MAAGEICIELPYDEMRFKVDEYGVLTMRPIDEMLYWLERFVGPNQPVHHFGLHDETPWRHHTRKLGIQNGLHGFYFLHRIHAIHFKLIWGGRRPLHTL